MDNILISNDQLRKWWYKDFFSSLPMQETSLLICDKAHSQNNITSLAYVMFFRTLYLHNENLVFLS